jgi:hypothetical protein
VGDSEGLSDRIHQVRLALALPLRAAISRERFGEMVGEEAGEPAYHGSTVKRWEEGAEPSLTALKGIVTLARKHGLDYVNLNWLAFGDDQVVVEANSVRAGKRKGPGESGETDGGRVQGVKHPPK